MSKKWWIRIWPLLAVLLSFAAFWNTAVWFNEEVFQPALIQQTQGFGAYYTAARLLDQGQISAEIYNPDYFRPLVLQDSLGRAEDIYNANPPTTALILWPLSSLGIEQARMVWIRLSLLFLLGGTALLIWGLGVPLRDYRRWPLWILAITFALLFQPAVQNFSLGQAYSLIFFLLATATAAFVKGRPTGGIPLALSLLLKTAGWPLLILLLWLRKRRYLTWLGGTAVLIFVGTLLVFPLNMWLTFARLLPQVGRSPLVCVPAYQTTRSWLCHLFAPDVVWQEVDPALNSIPIAATTLYFILGIFCLIVIMFLARKQPNAAFIAVICWSVLFLPLGESYHHLILLIPFIWLLVQADELGLVGQLLVILAAYFYLIEIKVNAPQLQSGTEALLAYPYLAGAWLLFLAVITRGLVRTKTSKLQFLQNKVPGP